MIFLGEKGYSLTRFGVRQMIKKRAKQAEVKYQAAHSFRLLFTLTMLRNGVDINSLQLLMGHVDLQTLRRYLKQTEKDTLEAHLIGSLVDKLI